MKFFICLVLSLLLVQAVFAMTVTEVVAGLDSSEESAGLVSSELENEKLNIKCVLAAVKKLAKCAAGGSFDQCVKTFVQEVLKCK